MSKENKDIETVEVEDAKEVKTEAKYKFIKQFPTSKKTYLIGEDCTETNNDVLAYLLTNKYIK